MAVTDCAGIGDEGLRPDRRIDLIDEPRAEHLVAELGAEDLGERFGRHEEVGTRGDPFRIVFADAASRNEDVEVWVVGQLSTPSVEYGAEPIRAAPRKRGSLASF